MGQNIVLIDKFVLLQSKSNHTSGLGGLSDFSGLCGPHGMCVHTYCVECVDCVVCVDSVNVVISVVCVLKGITYVLKHDDVSQLDHYCADAQM